jgi:hypothetical protein
MVDLVGICPKTFWEEWIAEGDAADGGPWTGEEWSWYTRSRTAKKITPGDRFYVVAHGKLRGYAPVVRVEWIQDIASFAIIRHGGGVSVTIDQMVPGFRGLRHRWWDRKIEEPFPHWRIP